MDGTPHQPNDHRRRANAEISAGRAHLDSTPHRAPADRLAQDWPIPASTTELAGAAKSISLARSDWQSLFHSILEPSKGGRRWSFLNEGFNFMISQCWIRFTLDRTLKRWLQLQNVPRTFPALRRFWRYAESISMEQNQQWDEPLGQPRSGARHSCLNLICSAIHLPLESFCAKPYQRL